MRSGTLLVVVFLLLSGSLMSGCLSSEQGGVVGIPGDEEARGDFYKRENRATISVPILNTYDEPKEIVVKFEVIVTEDNRYSALKKIRLPPNSQKEYTEEIHVPENETDEFLAQIIVSEDNLGVVEVKGEMVEDEARIDATIANTNFDSRNVALRFEVMMEGGNLESERMQVTLPENSMDEYNKSIPVNGTPEDYRVEIIE